MKVLHLSTSNGPGGAFQAAERLHQALRGNGVDSWMLVRDKRGDDPTILRLPITTQRLWARVARFLEQIPVVYRRSLFPQIHSPAWLGVGVCETIRRLNPDIISLRWVCGGYLSVAEIGRLAALRKPIVWTLSDMWPMAGAEHYAGDSRRYVEGYTRTNCPPSEKHWDLNRWTWERKRRAWAQLKNLTVISPSRWLARCAEQSVLLKGRRIEVVPTGTNLRNYRPIDQRQARALLQLPLDKNILLFTAASAASDPRKGYDLLVEILANLPPELKLSSHAVVVGSSQGAQLPIPATCLGYLHDELTLALAYSAADVFLAPYREENYPNTVIEAIACGTPVAAFAVGGLPDLLESLPGGMLAPAFDSRALAEKLAATLRHSEPKKQEQRGNIREFAEKHCDVQKQATLWLTTICEPIPIDPLIQVKPCVLPLNF